MALGQSCNIAVQLLGFRTHLFVEFGSLRKALLRLLEQACPLAPALGSGIS